MRGCPDCDSVAVMSIPPRGNGECSVCNGTGAGGIFDHAAEMIGGDKSTCYECHRGSLGDWATVQSGDPFHKQWWIERVA